MTGDTNSVLPIAAVPVPDAPEPTEESPATLSEPVRDHLGQQLRAVFTAEDGVPHYLGEPVVPEDFEPQIKRLETRLKTHEEGTGAVAQALDEILGDLIGPASAKPAG